MTTTQRLEPPTRIHRGDWLEGYVLDAFTAATVHDIVEQAKVRHDERGVEHIRVHLVHGTRPLDLPITAQCNVTHRSAA